MAAVEEEANGPDRPVLEGERDAAWAAACEAAPPGAERWRLFWSLLDEKATDDREW